MKRWNAGPRRIAKAAAVIIVVSLPIALRASGYMQMNFSGQSCMLAKGAAVTYDDAGTANPLSPPASIDVICPIQTSSGLVSNSNSRPPDQTLLNFGVVYVNPGGAGISCHGSVEEYFRQLPDSGVTNSPMGSGNHWQTEPVTGHSATQDYLTLVLPNDTGKLIAGGDAQQASVHCTLPGKSSTSTEVYAYTVSYSQ